jgi:hypothetical protein
MQHILAAHVSNKLAEQISSTNFEEDISSRAISRNKVSPLLSPFDL